MEMTLDEAIQHCKDMAKEEQITANYRIPPTAECLERAKEYLQFASWLFELKNRRERENGKKGHWVVKKVDSSHYHYYCSECNCRSKFVKSNYCPVCGKEMEV